MRCPVCGARMKKDVNLCVKCGTKLEDIKKASHQAVSKARAEFEPEKVVLSSYFPSDLNYVKTLLLCIFLGTFGAHYFYVKRPIPGIICAVGWSIFLLFYIICSFIFGPSETFTFSSYNLQVIQFFVSIIGALVFLYWIVDIIRIATKRFKVPVVIND
ncbi:MAG: TM2 domain-containing protein [Clostridia bacterium]|nr:TM2 domain-containing protein [Clostridia bacterium]